MLDELKKLLPGTFVSILITLLTTLVVFAGTFSSLVSRVDANTSLLKGKVDIGEFNAILKGQEKMNETFEKRFDRLEVKIDKLNEKGHR